MVQSIFISPNMLTKDLVDRRWNTSVFSDLKGEGPRKKGKKIEQIVSKCFKDIGHVVETKPHPSGDYDLYIDRMKHELKSSFVNENSDDKYSFLQIRPKQNFDYLTLATIHFDNKIDIYCIPKEDVKEYIEYGFFKPQHGGKSGSHDTFIYTGNMDIFQDFKFTTFHIRKDNEEAH